MTRAVPVPVPVPVLVFLIVLAGTAAWAQAAPATVEVRALAGEAVAPELIETLRIHLAGLATVDAGAPLAGATLPDRIAEASGALAAGGLVTWLELPPDESGAYIVVVVGERDGRAAVEVGRLDRADPAALSRLLALRVGAFLDETLAAGPASPVAVAAPPVAAAPVRRALGAIVEVGGGGEAGGDGWRGGGGLAVGVARARPGARVEAVAIGRFGWPRRSEAAEGAVTIGVVDVAIGGRLVVPAGGAWLGAAADVGARRIRADAMDGDGAAGGAVRWTARARVGLDARVELTPSVTLRGAIGVERGLGLERFTVHGATVAEVGGLAGAGELSLVVPL